MIEKNNFYKGIVMFTIIILYSGYAAAFGVGAAYFEGRPLEISPGETKEVIFNLQNGPGPEDITTKPSITKGSEIMTVSSENIIVPVGGSVDIIAKIKIPEDAKIGAIYPLEISFTTISNSGAGSFNLGASVVSKFDAIIVPAVKEIKVEKAQNKPLKAYIIIGVIILAILIWYSLRKNSKKK